MFKQSHMNMNEDDKAYKGACALHAWWFQAFFTRPGTEAMCLYIYMPG